MMLRISVWIFIYFGIQSHLSFTQVKVPRPLARAYTSPDQLVSMTPSLPFDQAIEVLNTLTKKFDKKVIINTKKISEPIGINIDNMHYLDAFEAILRARELAYEEHSDYYRIVEPKESQEDEQKPVVTFDTREVVISAVFFEADGSKLRQMGVSWDIFRGNDVNVHANMSAVDAKTSVLEISGSPAMDFGNLVTTFKALESDAVGEIVASPQITVRSKQKGRIQVGSDIAVTTQDFAGNTVTQFFSTGSIINVTPEVILHDSVYFIHLELKIERSNTATSQVGLEIKKTEAETSVLLLDGEETIIGGLYITEENRTREGVPFLKNLPWWFLGLRYVFGFDAQSLIKKELIILLKADLLPTLQERLEAKNKQKGVRPTLLENRVKFLEKMRYIKKQNDHYQK